MSATFTPKRQPHGPPEDEAFEEPSPDERGGFPEPVSYPERGDDAGPDGLSDEPPD